MAKREKLIPSTSRKWNKRQLKRLKAKERQQGRKATRDCRHEF